MNTFKTRIVFSILALYVLAHQFTASASTSDSLITAEDISLTSDGIELAASVLMPANPNGVGIVMLPGSGPAERAMMRPAANQLAGAGITVLIFDKRGSGSSQGDWTKTSLDELAGDAIAAMSFLRAKPGIDKVGLLAHSQGNWVASRSTDIGGQPDFIIAISGGGASPREVESYSYRHSVSAFSTEQQNAAMSLVDVYFDYLAGRLSFVELEQHIEPVNATSWYRRLGLSRVLVSEAYRPKWQWVADYDPAQSILNIRFPILVVLGGADHTIPLDTTITDWNRQLDVKPQPGNQISVLAGRDHHLNLPGKARGHGISSDAAVWSVINNWIETQLLSD